MRPGEDKWAEILTASQVGILFGVGYISRKKLANQIFEGMLAEKDGYALAAIKWGQINEAKARDILFDVLKDRTWKNYCLPGNKVYDFMNDIAINELLPWSETVVKEYSYAASNAPLFETLGKYKIGATPDGVVYGINRYRKITMGVEIKCPYSVGSPIISLSINHYLQIQTGLMLTGWESWIYSIYRPAEKTIWRDTVIGGLSLEIWIIQNSVKTHKIITDAVSRFYIEHGKYRYAKNEKSEILKTISDEISKTTYLLMSPHSASELIDDPNYDVFDISSEEESEPTSEEFPWD